MEDIGNGSSGSNNGGSKDRKIFIGGLNYSTTEDGLKDYFGQFGSLVDVVVMKFPDTKRSRGFGFVTYGLESEVDACQAARPHVIDGKQVETKRATPRERFVKTDAGQTVKRIFIGGLRDLFEDEDIQMYFSQFGNVLKVEQMTEKETGKKRGFGFVEFDDYDPVDKIVLKETHEINGHRVDVKKAWSKQDMYSRGGGSVGGRGRMDRSSYYQGPPQNGRGRPAKPFDRYNGGGGGGGGGWGGPPSNDYSGVTGDGAWGAGAQQSNDGWGNQGGGGSWNDGGGWSEDNGGWNSNRYPSNMMDNGYGGTGGGPMRSPWNGGGYRQSPYRGGGGGGGYNAGGRGGGRGRGIRGRE